MCCRTVKNNRKGTKTQAHVDTQTILCSYEKMTYHLGEVFITILSFYPSLSCLCALCRSSHEYLHRHHVIAPIYCSASAFNYAVYAFLLCALSLFCVSCTVGSFPYAPHPITYLPITQNRGKVERPEGTGRNEGPFFLLSLMCLCLAVAYVTS